MGELNGVPWEFVDGLIIEGDDGPVCVDVAAIRAEIDDVPSGVFAG